MTDHTKSIKDHLVEQFWDRYFTTIRLFRISEKTSPWYKKHVEAFIQFLPDIRLRDRKPEHIEQWLSQIGRSSNLEDWQFSQRSNALRLLYCHYLKITWANEFDWAYWMSGAMKLEADHATASFGDIYGRPTNFKQ